MEKELTWKNLDTKKKILFITIIIVYLFLGSLIGILRNSFYNIYLDIIFSTIFLVFCLEFIFLKGIYILGGYNRGTFALIEFVIFLIGFLIGIFRQF